MQKILIVEDDVTLAIALRDALALEGYLPEVARDGESGLKLALNHHFDLMVLDIMLPQKSGFDVCKQLRQIGNNIPIILLTARGLEIDKVLGLKMGADDYITKPFSVMELMARIEAVLRRTAKPQTDLALYQFDDIVVNFKTFEIIRNGMVMECSPQEFKLLKYFIEHRGEMISRDQLLNEVWSYNHFPITRTVDTHIAKLRQKIEKNPHNPTHLITVHGIGYKFV